MSGGSGRLRQIVRDRLQAATADRSFAWSRPRQDGGLSGMGLLRLGCLLLTVLPALAACRRNVCRGGESTPGDDSGDRRQADLAHARYDRRLLAVRQRRRRELALMGHPPRRAVATLDQGRRITIRVPAGPIAGRVTATMQATHFSGDAAEASLRLGGDRVSATLDGSQATRLRLTSQGRVETSELCIDIARRAGRRAWPGWATVGRRSIGRSTWPGSRGSAVIPKPMRWLVHRPSAPRSSRP